MRLLKIAFEDAFDTSESGFMSEFKWTSDYGYSYKEEYLSESLITEFVNEKDPEFKLAYKPMFIGSENSDVLLVSLGYHIGCYDPESINSAKEDLFLFLKKITSFWIGFCTDQGVDVYNSYYLGNLGRNFWRGRQGLDILSDEFDIFFKLPKVQEFLRSFPKLKVEIMGHPSNKNSLRFVKA